MTRARGKPVRARTAEEIERIDRALIENYNIINNTLCTHGERTVGLARDLPCSDPSDRDPGYH